MQSSLIAFLSLFTSSLVLANPVTLLEERAPAPVPARPLSPAQICSAVNNIVVVIKAQKATALCSQILGSAARTAVETTTTTIPSVATVPGTETSYTTATSVAFTTVPAEDTTSTTTLTLNGGAFLTLYDTVYETATRPVFVRGESPLPEVKVRAASAEAEPTLALEERAQRPTPVVLPAWLRTYGISAVQTACACIGVAPGVAVATNTVTETSYTVTSTFTQFRTVPGATTATDTVTITTTPVTTITRGGFRTVTKYMIVRTLYPCAATALANPASGYYLSEVISEDPGTSVSSTDSLSAVACCNKCFFDSQYCRFAIFDASTLKCSITTSNPGALSAPISYDPNAVNNNVATCPNGAFTGLQYQAMGDTLRKIPGPCGLRYLYGDTKVTATRPVTPEVT